MESKQNKRQAHRCREHIGGCQRSGLTVEVGEMGEWDQKGKNNKIKCILIATCIHIYANGKYQDLEIF